MYGNTARVGGTAGETVFSVIKSYIEVTKPRSVFLLVFTAAGAMLLAAGAGRIEPQFWMKAVLAITLACSGVNAVSCYVDRDLDAIMERTRNRPIPSGRINPAYKALVWGLVQFGAALYLAWTLNLAAFLCILLGMLGYVGIYNIWLKRKSTWNIILGGFSGGLPVLFGWAAVTGRIDLVPVLIALLVVLWIPNHIWNLAIFFKEDYRRVGVPMLPVVCDTDKTLLYILVTVIMMYGISLAVYYYAGLGMIYLVTAIVCGAAILAGNLYLYFKPGARRAWWLYKFSSPYLFILFLGLMVDHWVYILRG